MARILLALATIALAPSIALAQAVLFRNSPGFFDTIPGWDHVALEDSSDTVWESHPGYSYPRFGLFPPNFAWDPDAGGRRVVPPEAGVQHWHSEGSFRWNSANPSVNGSTGYARIPISASLANAMASEALLWEHSGYPSVANPYNFSAARQKGSDGFFTCCGLVEFCAEQVGHNGGQGFVPNCMEELRVLGQSFSSLTPQILFDAIAANWSANACRPRLRGRTDPVDFLLTDPLGRRVGYTAATGLVNEIPGLSYTGDGVYEEIVWSTPLSGVYSITLYGLNANALAYFGDGRGGGFLFDGFLAAGQTVSGTFGVACVSDVDDGSSTGTPDGGTGIEDLLYYLGLYDAGNPGADVDDGSGLGVPDGGIGIEDLLFYLGRYDAGC